MCPFWRLSSVIVRFLRKYKRTCVTVSLSDDYHESSSGSYCKYENTYFSVCIFEDYHQSSLGFYWNIRVPTLLCVALMTIINHRQVSTADMRLPTFVWPIPVVTLSKMSVDCRSIAGIAGSNPFEAWMSVVSCECCVLSGRGLCDGWITRREESYWVWSRNLIQGA
jgi:hypothetical protein